MSFIDSDLVGTIRSYYERASKYLQKNNRYLKKSDKIVLGEISRVIKALDHFIASLGIASTDDQHRIVELIFDLHSCRDEEIDKESGAHQAYVEAVREFEIAARVVRLAMDSEPDLNDSKDVKTLFDWISSCTPDPRVLSLLKNYQAMSRYPDLIYQIVSAVRSIKKKNRVKGIYSELDTLLHEMYPAGLRKSRTSVALEEAYKEGRRRARRLVQ
ncbi:MAG: hypothetical protein IPJ71_10630 [Bdellovibrionales bacterium]|nr:hypothetical protein [Bdellovibrionales bacterium]